MNAELLASAVKLIFLNELNGDDSLFIVEFKGHKLEAFKEVFVHHLLVGFKGGRLDNQ
jgi:hypothetical protein